MKLILGMTGAFILGVLLTVLTDPIINASLEHFMRNRKLKKKPEHDQIMNSLSVDTQIILKQYMEQFDLWGEIVYIVRDIKRFDLFLRGHVFNNLRQYGACDFNYCIKENLKNGSGFVIFLNGEEYIAIPSPQHVNADCLVK